MESHRLLTDLALALLAAFLGGFAARALRLPLLIGYLLAGIAVGPHTPGFIANEASVEAVAHLGVALLMFVVGIQFSLEELSAMRRVALIGGGAQILGTILLGTCLGLALGWGVYGGFFLGCAIALSSTAVMMRILEERGELGTTHGTAMLGILVMQDLTVVLMVLLLPSLHTVAAEGPAALIDVGVSLLRAALFLGVTLFLSLRGVPLLLDRIARTGSRELFLLAVVCICLAAGYLASLAGFSLELGAFLAGLVISESDYAHEALSQVRPLRDVFASLFFVSIGMLLDPQFLLHNLAAVLAVVAAIVLGKGLITSLAVFALGYHGRTALLTGFGLAQIGEFSFVLAGIGVAQRLIPSRIASVILSAALITLLLAPWVFTGAGPLYAALNRNPRLSRRLNRGAQGDAAPHGEGDRPARVLVLGGGRVGGCVSEALRAMAIPHVMVDYDAKTRNRLLAEGVPVLYGDATSEVVLGKAVSPGLELAIAALPDAQMTRVALRTLKTLRPDLPILARVHRRADIGAVRRAGADVVIQAEFEAAAELIDQGLHRLGMAHDTVRAYLEVIRREQDEPPADPPPDGTTAPPPSA